MKPTFHAAPVNGPFEDPSVYVGIMREKRALLFDSGDLGRLDAGSLMKLSDLFISHAHIDHFIGFDTILRAILAREAPLRVFGPENIIDCIEGKLKGYTWNLIKNYPVKIEAYAIKSGSISHASFHAEESFRRIDNPEVGFNGVLIEEPMLRVKGLLLSHDTPVIAYSLEEDFHININKAVLEEMGLPVGPWLSDLKREIRRQRTEDKRQNTEYRSQKSEVGSQKTEFMVEGRSYALDELMKIVTITRGQKIAYVMDVSPTNENIERILPFVKGSDMLFCEAYFLERDRDRAAERNHLTAALAGRIAREANVGNLTLLHFSPKYRDCADEVYEEAMREFRK